MLLGNAQVRKKLFVVNRFYFLHRFEFDYHSTFHKYVQTKIYRQDPTIIYDI